MIVLPQVQLSYPHLIEPTQFNAQSKPKYSAKLVFPADSPAFAAMKEMMFHQMRKNGYNHSDQKLLEYVEMLGHDICLRPEVDGSWCVKASNPVRPNLWDSQNNDCSGKPDLWTFGNYVNAIVQVYSYGQGKKFAAKLLTVQFVAEGTLDMPQPSADLQAALLAQMDTPALPDAYGARSHTAEEWQEEMLDAPVSASDFL
jgi:hypothetical protein